MLRYRYRLKDLYNKPIASIAILIDTNPAWRPQVYREDLWDSWLEMGFPIIKVTDYQTRVTELEHSTNSFAVVLLAQLVANQKISARLATKTAVTRLLYQKGWLRADILSLYTFIDWVIALPLELELNYHQYVETLEKELAVEYVTTAERIGLKRGIEQGFKYGESFVLVHLLEQKFGAIPRHYQEQIEQADTATILKWAIRLLQCQSLDELFKNAVTPG